MIVCSGEMYTQKISNKFVQGATLVVDNSYMLTTSKGKLSGDSTVKSFAGSRWNC